MTKPDVVAPQPPELTSPWRTERRVELQEDARAFARDSQPPACDAASNGRATDDLEKLVELITDRVLEALGTAAV